MILNPNIDLNKQVHAKILIDYNNCTVLQKNSFKYNLQGLGECFVRNDDHASIEEVRSNLLVHHVDISLVSGVETHRIEPTSALD